jgi:hypothetical protein
MRSKATPEGITSKKKEDKETKQEKTTRKTELTWIATGRDTDKKERHFHRSWRSAVKIELAKLLRGETELRDLVYFSNKSVAG